MDAEPQFPQQVALLPLLDVVIYPQTVTPLAVSQPASIRLLDDAIATQAPIALVALRDPHTRPEPITLADCYPIGTLALPHRLLRLPDQTLRVAVEGLERVLIEELIQDEPYLRARIRVLPDTPDETAETYAMGQTSAALAAALINLMPAQSSELLDEVLQIDEPQRLSYLLAARLLQRSNLAERQQLLEVAETRVRLDLMQSLLRREYQLFDHARYVEGADSAPTEAAELIPLPDRPETPLRLTGLPPRPGRAVGLAWNNGRPRLATIEALALSGHGNITLTGRAATIHDQALVARSWVHSNAALLGLSNANFSRADLHLHVRGDLPDSPMPTLGLAVIAALVSCLSGRIVLDGTLLNGELTLLGELLPAENLDALALAAVECGADMVIHGPALPTAHPHTPPRRLSFAQVEDALAAALSSPLEH